MRKLNVCLTSDLFSHYDEGNKLVLVVDILRATSVISTAFHYGISELIPVSSVEQAKQYMNKEGYIVAAESKRDFNEDGTPFYKKHKIYLYKEDFQNFKEHLNELTDYIIKERGEEIISLKDKETPSEEIKTDETEEVKKTEKKEESKEKEEAKKEEPTTDFTEVNFEDLGNEDE